MIGSPGQAINTESLPENKDKIKNSEKKMQSHGNDSESDSDDGSTGAAIELQFKCCKKDFKHKLARTKLQIMHRINYKLLLNVQFLKDTVRKDDLIH